MAFDDLLDDVVRRALSGGSLESLEDLLGERGREVLRLALQGAIDEGNGGDVGDTVKNARGDEHRRRRIRGRTVSTRLGSVDAPRWAYEHEGDESLHPGDAQLNLPGGKFSHGLRKDIAFEVAKGSFQDAIEAIKRYRGVEISKGCAEQIAREVAADFEAFYVHVGPSAVAEADDTVVLSIDGAGVVVREEDLRDATRQAAEESAQRKRKRKRLLPGEKRNRKRRAAVAAVFAQKPVPRTADDIVPLLATPADDKEQTSGRPVAKRTWASLMDSMAVVREMFEQADRLDAGRQCDWVVLVDGEKQQIDQLAAEANARGVEPTFILDVVHVLDYLWSAAEAIHGTGEDAEHFVTAMLYLMLRGFADQVVVRLRNEAKALNAARRKNVYKAAKYIEGHLDMVRYHEYLAKGFPIATGVIEGACRHLIRRRMNNARWSLDGAEAVLKLRSLRISDDFDNYLEFHMRREFGRNHAAKYAEPPPAIEENGPAGVAAQPPLRLVKS